MACVRFGPILLKNSDLGEARKFAWLLNRIAHHRHEGTAVDAENLVQEPRSAFAPASNEITPLQIQIDENQAPSCKRVFQHHRPRADLAIARAPRPYHDAAPLLPALRTFERRRHVTAVRAERPKPEYLGPEDRF
jgi:hypothetical protein